jgi:hypothetical protein
MEAMETMWEGGLASMDRLFRVKHLASQRYLAVDPHPLTGVLHLYMTRTYLSPSTTFQMEPFDSSVAGSPDKTISFDDLLFMRNTKHDKYLTLDTSLESLTNISTVTAGASSTPKRSFASKWKKVSDSAKLTTILSVAHKKAENEVEPRRTAIGRRDPKDAYDLEPIDLHFVATIGSVRSGLMGLIQLMQVFRGQASLFPESSVRSEAEVDAIFEVHVDFVQGIISKSTNLVAILEALIRACSMSDVSDPLVREGLPVLSTQMMIREQGVMAAISEIHHVVFEVHNIPPWSIERGRLGAAFFRVTQLTFRLLKQVVAGNARNKTFLAPNAKAIQNSLGSSFKAINALRELFHDNTPLLKTAVDVDLVARIISLAEHGRQSR